MVYLPGDRTGGQVKLLAAVDEQPDAPKGLWQALETLQQAITAE